MSEHGGVRKGAGRKRKVDEEKVRRLGEDAIIEVYGSLEKYYKHIATEAKESFPHLKLLQEYVFGKPTERVILDNDELQDDFDLENLTDEELALIVKIYERQKPNTSEE